MSNPKTNTALKLAELIKQRKNLTRLKQLKKTNPEEFKKLQEKYKQRRIEQRAQAEIDAIKRNQGMQTSEHLKKFYPSLEKELVIEPGTHKKPEVKSTTQKKPEVKILSVEDFVKRNIELSGNPIKDTKTLTQHTQAVKEWLAEKKIFTENPKLKKMKDETIILFGLMQGKERGQFEIRQIKTETGWYWRETLQMPKRVITVFRNAKGKIIPKPERKLKTF
jgi:hypothetical protein